MILLTLISPFFLSYISSGANNLASLTLIGITSSIEIAGTSAIIEISGLGYYYINKRTKLIIYVKNKLKTNMQTYWFRSIMKIT
jgi:hypothetical protein